MTADRMPGAEYTRPLDEVGRCPDMTDPVIRTFQCVLDQGHAGPHVPYVPPTVDEWRAMQAEMAGMRGFFGLARESVEPCPGCGL